MRVKKKCSGISAEDSYEEAKRKMFDWYFFEVREIDSYQDSDVGKIGRQIIAFSKLTASSVSCSIEFKSEQVFLVSTFNSFYHDLYTKVFL